MERQERLWRWIISLPLFVSVVAWFTYALFHNFEMFRVEAAGGATILAIGIAWMTYGIFADQNAFEDW